MAVVPAQSYDSVDFQVDIKVGGTQTVRATPASRVPASPMEAQRLNLIQETVRGSCSRAIPASWISEERSLNSGEECPDSEDLYSQGV